MRAGHFLAVAACGQERRRFDAEVSRRHCLSDPLALSENVTIEQLAQLAGCDVGALEWLSIDQSVTIWS